MQGEPQRQKLCRASRRQACTLCARRDPRQTEECSNAQDSLTWTRSHRESNHSQDPPVQNFALSVAEDDCTEGLPEGSTSGITRPASLTPPNEQRVKPSTIIGERCVPSRLKSAAEFEGSCVNVYTEEDSAWGDNNGAPTSSQNKLVSRPRAPAYSHTEEDADLPSACSLSASCSEPSVEAVVPVIEPLHVCLMVSLTFDTLSDCHRALVPCSSDLYNSSVARTSATMCWHASLDSFPSQCCASVCPFRPQARRASLQRTATGQRWNNVAAPARLEHAAGGRRQRCTAPREAGVRHRMNLRCRKHE